MQVWELDFCSRPILDERNKKVWELIICDPERNFEYTEYFPNNKINSVQVIYTFSMPCCFLVSSCKLGAWFFPSLWQRVTASFWVYRHQLRRWTYLTKLRYKKQTSEWRGHPTHRSHPHAEKPSLPSNHNIKNITFSFVLLQKYRHHFINLFSGKTCHLDMARPHDVWAGPYGIAREDPLMSACSWKTCAA